MKYRRTKSWGDLADGTFAEATICKKKERIEKPKEGRTRTRSDSERQLIRVDLVASERLEFSS
ncbi:hypothetical protein ALC62_10823 [Cyphomyrmex costatus]|uniref:Uncharacterized protein n=1 Tax=Cyphomyrmex costatus TaxID=456900 RepID=A0A195CCD0_9HYME|nr:hypothetical protein ALC62_10823 [Cyphomyrmex costatus]